jgi:hypothetical protein
MTSTLLAAVWEVGGDEEAILAALEAGELELAGNFKGHEAELVEGAREEES